MISGGEERNRRCSSIIIHDLYFMVTLKLEKYSIWYLRVAESQFSFFDFVRQHLNRNQFRNQYRVEITNKFAAHLVFSTPSLKCVITVI